MSEHIQLDEQADADAGLLDAARSRHVEEHLRSCADCRTGAQALAGVRERLATLPSPPMPAGVADRLARVLAAEGRTRAGGSYAKPGLGAFGAEIRPGTRLSRLLGTAVVACGTAAVVGFGGYFGSATIGLDEPTTLAPAMVSRVQLGSQAAEVRTREHLGMHLFSHAWHCGRQATDGWITAVTAAQLDGRPALLVFTRAEDHEQVTVVTGCGGEQPNAEASALLPR